jgi:hypothetical protein
MNENFKLKPGEELVLTVPKKPHGGRGGAARKKKAPISADRRAEYLPRRAQKGFINFFDLGQETDGEGGWLDFGFNAPIHEEVITAYDGVDTSDTRYFWSPQANWKAMTDTINAIDRATWKTHFRKVEYDNAERFGIDIVNEYLDGFGTHEVDGVYPAAKNGTRRYTNFMDRTSHGIAGTKWTPQGLKLTAPDLPYEGDHHWGLNITGGIGFCFSPGLAIPSSPPIYNTYYTHTYDPDAEHVTFDLLAGETNIFIVPLLCTHFFYDNTGFGPDASYYMIGPAMTINREIFFSLNMGGEGDTPFFSPLESDDDSAPGHGELSIDGVVGGFPGGGFISAITEGWGTAGFDAIAAWVAGAPGTKFIQVINHAGAGTFHEDLHEFVEVSDPGNIWQVYFQNVFRGDQISVYPVGSPSEDHHYNPAGGEFTSTFIPTLVAVIEQKGNWYYVWYHGGPGVQNRIITRY